MPWPRCGTNVLVTELAKTATPEESLPKVRTQASTCVETFGSVARTRLQSFYKFL